MRLQTLALESGLSVPESGVPFAFGDNPAESLFDKGLQRRPLAVGQLASLFEEAIRYLYGCFHMENHITPYTKMSMTMESLRNRVGYGATHGDCSGRYHLIKVADPTVGKSHDTTKGSKGDTGG